MQTQNLRAISSTQRLVKLEEEASGDPDQHAHFMDGKTEVFHTQKCHPSSVPDGRKKSHGAGGLADCPSSLFFLAASHLSSAQAEKKDFCPQSKDK